MGVACIQRQALVVFSIASDETVNDQDRVSLGTECRPSLRMCYSVLVL